jgi:hypothetical protein
MADEQVASALHDRGLRGTVDLDDFARRCARHRDADRDPDIGLYHFAEIYANGDAAAYDAAWAAFHRAGFEYEPFGFDAADSRDRAARRTDYGVGGWNEPFLETTVDEFDPAALEPL